MSKKELKYIVVRGDGARQTVFCRFSRGIAVVSDESFRDAKLFGSHNSAMDVVLRLNMHVHPSDERWYVREYYI